MTGDECLIEHRSYRTRAQCEWPYAVWIVGRGRFATLAWCRVLSVMLHDTLEDAQQAQDTINRYGCGGMCTRDHRIVDLEWAHRKHVRRRRGARR